jgi:beta-glucanase (GH16 family)
MTLIRALAVAAALAGSAAAQDGWKLVWSDEFDGPARSAPDATKWTYDVGATGWGNRELENYTRSLDNASLDGNGNLVIQALKTESGYTSARLKTQGLYTMTYGKIEARLKIPYGQGIWPAFWLLGENSRRGGWPRCGEIDVMENIGKEPATVHATVHGPGYSGGSGIGKPYALTGGRFADDFHIYTVVWNRDSLEFFVDGNSYHKMGPSSIPSGSEWVFDHPFFIILNVAVGGGWPGNPDDATKFPQRMLVDYVRVYQAQ